LLSVLVYAGTLGHAGAYDDHWILESPLLRDPWNLRELFTDGFYARPDRTLGLYRPIGQWSLVLNAALAEAGSGRFDAWIWFHAVNLGLHALASFLVYHWLVRLELTRFVAGAAAILWAVHPVHAEVAANVTARYESLAAIFGLGFLLAQRARRSAIAALLLLFALWCKESAIAFLPLAIAVDALFPVEGRRIASRTWLAPAAVLLLWFGLRAAALAGENPSLPYVENPVAAAPAWVRVLTAGKVQILYLRDQLLPLWLSTDHSYREILPVRSFADPFWLGFAGLLAAAGVLAWKLRTRRPELALCVLGYAILFAPASNFLYPIGTLMADRLAYAPSIFTCLLAALAIFWLAARTAGFAIVGALAILLSVRSFSQAQPWRDDDALFREQVRTAPESAKSHGNLGDALRRRGEWAEAVREYRASIAIYPFRPEPHLGLAQAYERLDEEPELVLNTWADAIRFGTLGERPILRRILSATDLGDWPRVRALRAEMAAADPEDRFLPRVDHVLLCAELLSRLPADGADFAAGKELFAREDWAGAEARFKRALHRRDLPESETGDTLLEMAICNQRLQRPGRAEHLRKLAAEWSARR